MTADSQSQAQSLPQGVTPSQLKPPAGKETLDALIEQGLKHVREHSLVPRCTYRVQLHPQHLRLADASRLVAYLAALGISHLYASPHLKCRSGSSHGYDVVDHGQINAQLGSEEDLAMLHRQLAEQHMGMLLDWVPNHMAIGHENPLWMDVLENGPSAWAARFFDIDWQPVKSALGNKVLVPVLGDQYGLALERGEIKVKFDQGSFFLEYFEHRFPLAPRSYARLLKVGLETLVARLGAQDKHVQELQSIVTEIGHLPGESETDPDRLVEQRREKEVVKRRLAQLVEASGDIRAHVEASVRAHSVTADDPAGLTLLHELMEAQGYRLAHWRVAAAYINYRRFFDVNELAAIRMEDPEVFDHAHRRLFQWIADGWVGGLRVDHPDGLFDPTQYFRRLQAGALLVHCREAMRAAKDAQQGQPWDKQAWDDLAGPLHERCLEEVSRKDAPLGGTTWVVAEKILGRRERLPESWAVSGTTGYDFLNAVNGLFVSRDNELDLEAIYRRFLGRSIDFTELLYTSKKLILASAFASEMQVCSRRLERIADSDRRTRDFTPRTLVGALEEIIACFPVYRTYIPQGDEPIDERDCQYVDLAVARARQRAPATHSIVFDFIRDILLKNHPPGASPAQIQERLEFLGKVQQLTAPATAKGMEDTTFYIYNRLTSQNEVGGVPERMGTSVPEFHAQNRQRLTRAPGSLLSTSTHDTKRGEDVRLRIDVLSEIPAQWQRHLSIWSRMNRKLRTEVDGRPAPDRNDEYMIYQTLLGSWPGGPPVQTTLERYVSRIESYLVKAAREAKVHTSWIDPHTAYEEALTGFVKGILHRPAQDPWWASFLELQTAVSRVAAQSSIAQVVFKTASPGVADFYQGCELWDLRLVDPDNRQPVDFRERERLLREIQERAVPDALADVCADLARLPDDPRLKLFVTWRALHLRREHPALFLDGDYVPLETFGKAAAHVVAFARIKNGQCTIALGGRLLAGLLQSREVLLTEMAVGEHFWAGTWIAIPDSIKARRFKNTFTGRVAIPDVREGRLTLDVAQLFDLIPAALLDAGPERFLTSVGGGEAGDPSLRAGTVAGTVDRTAGGAEAADRPQRLDHPHDLARSVTGEEHRPIAPWRTRRAA